MLDAFPLLRPDVSIRPSVAIEEQAGQGTTPRRESLVWVADSRFVTSETGSLPLVALPEANEAPVIAEVRRMLAEEPGYGQQTADD